MDWKNLLAHAAAAFLAAALLSFATGADNVQSVMAGAGAAGVTIKAFCALPSKETRRNAPQTDDAKEAE